jgi:hypothetical protein
MFDDYRMLRSSGITPIGAALMSVYLLVVAGPIIIMSDWVGKNHVGETGFEFDDDFDGNVEFIEDPPFGPIALAENQGPFDDDLIDGPPTGCKEWEEWIDRKV